MRSEKLSDATDNKDVKIEVLEKLPKKSMEFFIEMLTEEKIEKQKGVFLPRTEASVTRFIQSLKSLFNYLTEESEDEDGECYFYRNVMSKIKTPKKSESAARRAKRINSAILTQEQMDGLVDYVKHSYIHTLSPGHQKRFIRDQLRDIAIISLFLGSGIRVNELAGLLLTDIDLKNDDISVLRKGNKLDTVSITPTASNDLRAYLDVREEQYKPEDSNKFVFLTKYGGKANPIAVETIQTIIGKYSKSYLEGKNLAPINCVIPLQIVGWRTMVV